MGLMGEPVPPSTISGAIIEQELIASFLGAGCCDGLQQGVVYKGHAEGEDGAVHAPRAVFLALFVHHVPDQDRGITLA